MKIPKLASTIFLTIAICTLYLFALIFYMLLNVDPKTATVLKDSLTLTSSFFGGIATLVATYIATKLFNDWRDEKIFLILKDKIDLANKIIEEMNDDLYVIQTKKFSTINNIRRSFYDLYEIILSLNINSEDIDLYKKLHLKVAKTIINLILDGNRTLTEDEVNYIMYYRGTIWDLRTTLTNHLEKVLKNP